MKVSLYRLTIGDFFYIGSTSQSLRQRFNEHKSWNKWKIEDWSNATIELIEEFECDTKRQKEEREDYYIKININDTNCLNVRRAYINDDERKEINKKIGKEWCLKNEDKLKEYTTNRNKTKVKCDKCECNISLPNIQRHKERCGLHKISRSTGEKMIYKTECNMYQLQIKRKDIKYIKNFKTLEEAVKERNERIK